MQDSKPLVTITQYSMTTARGMILASVSFDSVEQALQLPSLCAGTHSIVIKNHRAGTDSVFNPELVNAHVQLKQELKELFSDEFTTI